VSSNQETKNLLQSRNGMKKSPPKLMMKMENSIIFNLKGKIKGRRMKEIEEDRSEF